MNVRAYRSVVYVHVKKGTVCPFMGRWRSVEVVKSLNFKTKTWMKKQKASWNVCMCANACGGDIK